MSTTQLLGLVFARAVLKQLNNEQVMNMLPENSRLAVQNAIDCVAADLRQRGFDAIS